MPLNVCAHHRFLLNQSKTAIRYKIHSIYFNQNLVSDDTTKFLNFRNQMITLFLHCQILLSSQVSLVGQNNTGDLVNDTIQSLGRNESWQFTKKEVNLATILISYLSINSTETLKALAMIAKESDEYDSSIWE